MISTRGRYALRVMIDLAEHNHGTYIPLKDIAERQEIPPKYLESIMTTLSKANCLASLHGKGGGYKLNKSPDQYTIGNILTLTEVSLAPVSCLVDSENDCKRTSDCKTHPMWVELNQIIQSYFHCVTIADLMDKDCFLASERVRLDSFIHHIESESE